MATLNLVCNSITRTKNGKIFMANTAKGGFIVRKTQLDKRNIVVPDNEPYKFTETTVVVVKTHAVGDYLYPENGGVATQDSSTLDPETGEPSYKKGDKPKWTSEGASVASFVSFAEFKAQIELERLMAQ